MFFQRESCTVALCIFSLRIVKSLQLCGRRKITEPHKYYLVWIIFLWCIFFSIFASHRSENFIHIPIRFLKPILKLYARAISRKTISQKQVSTSQTQKASRKQGTFLFLLLHSQFHNIIVILSSITFLYTYKTISHSQTHYLSQLSLVFAINACWYIINLAQLNHYDSH